MIARQAVKPRVKVFGHVADAVRAEFDGLDRFPLHRRMAATSRNGNEISRSISFNSSGSSVISIFMRVVPRYLFAELTMVARPTADSIK